ncbi:MAG: DNA polymerase III subunit delta' [Asticcacaulis sp.]
MAEIIAHPRDVYRYQRGETVEAAVRDALENGRFHHAWLLCGPEGVGKATFAYRLARYLLSRTRDAAFGPLGVSPEDADARLIAARAHPDLLVLDREGDDGKMARSITVDAARGVAGFFSQTPSRSAWRVAIVDAVDDMNVNAANALLKTLEEPPPRGVLFLVSHQPGRLLPTIRSRCRRLGFAPWPEADVADFLRTGAGLDPASASALAAMAHGAPGRGLSLYARGALSLEAIAASLVEGTLKDPAELLSQSDKFRGAEGAARFVLLLERILEALRALSLDPTTPARKAQAAAGLWSRLMPLADEAEGINLDRADLFWSMQSELNALSRL